MTFSETLSGADFLSMVRSGVAELDRNRQEINDLNVFPIPDGDTGDNMYMTVDSGRSAAAGAIASDGSLGAVAAAVSSGMLLGARGNSGVILSRIFAGIAKGLQGRQDAGTPEFCAALRCGVEESYKAVSVPVEGTILTVLKDSVEAVSAAVPADFESLWDLLLQEMEAALDRTPDQLPVLKEAGVVDSGGAGLLCIFRGMADFRNAVQTAVSEEPVSTTAAAVKPALNLDAFTSESELTFGYCTEFLLRLQSSKVDLDSFDESEIRDYLVSVGDSVVCFRDGSIVKVHVHTKTPGEILNHCQKYGEYLTLKIENMTLQHHETTIQNNFRKTRKPCGIVVVASGAGLVNAFREAGADEVIEGGQTMNPSAGSFIEAFERIDADTIYVFPSNSNILLTARQAAGMYEKSRVVVFESKNIGAGYVATASIDKSSKDVDATVAAVEETMSHVTCAQVTHATRNSTMDGLDIKEGDFLGISSGKILIDEATPEQVLLALCKELGAVDHDVALIIYGSEADPEAAATLPARLAATCPMTEFILTDGGQPVYNYILVLC